MPATRSCEAQTYQRWLSWTPLGAPVVPEVNMSAALPSAVARLRSAPGPPLSSRASNSGESASGEASSTVTSSSRSGPPTAASLPVPRSPATASRGSETSSARS